MNYVFSDTFDHIRPQHTNRAFHANATGSVRRLAYNMVKMPVNAFASKDTLVRNVTNVHPYLEFGRNANPVTVTREAFQIHMCAEKDVSAR